MAFLPYYPVGIIKMLTLIKRERLKCGFINCVLVSSISVVTTKHTYVSKEKKKIIFAKIELTVSINMDFFPILHQISTVSRWKQMISGICQFLAALVFSLIANQTEIYLLERLYFSFLSFSDAFVTFPGLTSCLDSCCLCFKTTTTIMMKT